MTVVAVLLLLTMLLLFGICMRVREYADWMKDSEDRGALKIKVDRVAGTGTVYVALPGLKETTLSDNRYDDRSYV